ncbi:MAG: hypothetical protein H6667_15400 [Ardenticatenaceae bacterium]|nr:hypothetical protein [Ardenticatenaceae bacterium]
MFRIKATFLWCKIVFLFALLLIFSGCHSNTVFPVEVPELPTSTTSISIQETLPPKSTMTPTSSSTPLSTQTPSNTPTSLHPPTSRNSATETPTLIPLPNFEIVYTRNVDQNDFYQGTELWLFITETQESKLLYTTEPDSITGFPKWHPFNNQVYFSVMRKDLSWSLWCYDLDLSQAFQVTDWTSSTLRGIVLDWSSNGQWVRLYTGSFSMGENEDYLLMNVETGDFVSIPLLDKNSFAWSPLEPELVAYFAPKLSREHIFISRLPSLETVQTIPLDHIPNGASTVYSPHIAWQPKTNDLYVIMQETSFTSALYQYDARDEITNSHWLKLQSIDFADIDDFQWSPSGNWLTTTSNIGNFIWGFYSETLSERVLIYSGKGVRINNWQTQPTEQIVAIDVGRVLLLDPSLPLRQNQRMVFDYYSLYEDVFRLDIDVRIH